MLESLAFILQVQCGFQTIGAVTASYGNVVYVTAESHDIPKVAFFKMYQDQSKSHTFCGPLKQALASGRSVTLKINDAKDELVELQISEK